LRNLTSGHMTSVYYLISPVICHFLIYRFLCTDFILFFFLFSTGAGKLL
jgi:hypothetical protein